jgi:hypothetical protein
MSGTIKTDKEAADLYKNDQAAAIKYITSYSINAGNNTVSAWKELYKFLFVKYMDGNVKTKQAVPKGYKMMNPKLSQPGYGDEWNKMIVKMTGDRFREK